MMLDFQQKRKLRSILYHRATLIILGIIVLFILHSTWVVYQKKRESEVLRNIAEEHVKELSARDIELKAQIERIQTDAGLEEEIRSKFNVVKENENVVVLVEDKSSVSTTTDQNHGFWQKIKGFFIGK